jgi:hypothetical protein
MANLMTAPKMLVMRTRASNAFHGLEEFQNRLDTAPPSQQQSIPRDTNIGFVKTKVNEHKKGWEHDNLLTSLAS